MAERRTTSIKADPEIWKEAKKLAIDKGLTLTDFIEELITKELEKSKHEKDRKKKD